MSFKAAAISKVIKLELYSECVRTFGTPCKALLLTSLCVPTVRVVSCHTARCSRCAEGFAVDARGNCPAAAPSVELEDLEDPRAALAGMAALSGVRLQPCARGEEGWGSAVYGTDS